MERSRAQAYDPHYCFLSRILLLGLLSSRDDWTRQYTLCTVHAVLCVHVPTLGIPELSSVMSGAAAAGNLPILIVLLIGTMCSNTRLQTEIVNGLVQTGFDETHSRRLVSRFLSGVAAIQREMDNTNKDTRSLR